jgi:hypothetical protein
MQRMPRAKLRILSDDASATISARDLKRPLIGNLVVNTEREPAATKTVRGSPWGGPLFFSIDTLNRA